MPAAFMPLSSPSSPAPLPRVCQISEYHCGPAVLQMLLGQWGVHANQERLTDLAQVATTIKKHGTRVDQLARAVAWLREDVMLWYKDRATTDDLIALVCKYHCPAGVEWQGLFEDSEEDEDFEEGDYGHYSIVTDIDQERGLITLRDPYPDFCHKDRVFKLDWFVKRWWDVNPVPLPGSRRYRLIKDRNMLFVVTDKHARFPALLGMTRGEF